MGKWCFLEIPAWERHVNPYFHRVLEIEKMNRKMSQNTESISNERFERKFYLPTLPFGAFEVMLKHHPMRFREVYPQRYVNNIYLDTFDFENLDYSIRINDTFILLKKSGLSVFQDK